MLPKKKNLKILTADKPLRKSMVIIPIFNPVFEKKKYMPNLFFKMWEALGIPSIAILNLF